MIVRGVRGRDAIDIPVPISPTKIDIPVFRDRPLLDLTEDGIISDPLELVTDKYQIVAIEVKFLGTVTKHHPQPQTSPEKSRWISRFLRSIKRV